MSKSSLGKRRQKLWSSLENGIGMIQGSLFERYLPCGKEGCKCREGAKHGPFYYLTYLEAGKLKTQYIPKDKVKEVKKGIKVYKKAKKIIAEVADINHRLLKERGVRKW